VCVHAGRWLRERGSRQYSAKVNRFATRITYTTASYHVLVGQSKVAGMYTAVAVSAAAEFANGLADGSVAGVAVDGPGACLDLSGAGSLATALGLSLAGVIGGVGVHLLSTHIEPGQPPESGSISRQRRRQRDHVMAVRRAPIRPRAAARAPW
jgi:hypothetical protein